MLRSPKLQKGQVTPMSILGWTKTSCILASWCKGEDGVRAPPLCGGTVPPSVDDVYDSRDIVWSSLV